MTLSFFNSIEFKEKFSSKYVLFNFIIVSNSSTFENKEFEFNSFLLLSPTKTEK